MKRGILVLGMLVLLPLAAPLTRAQSADPPNIVFVLFDDLGYGQPRSFVSDSEFPMPHLEQLSLDGMTFTDAHSASAVCTPTRYGLLTGRYPSRIGQFGVCTTYSAPIIPTTRLTVAGLLKKNGYHTACVGKWHLGLNWVDGKPGQQNKVPLGARFTDGPLDVGFDYFCGFTHARNIGTIIEQDEVVAHVTPSENQPLMISRAVDYIEGRRNHDEPFFLYFPMCPPHTPVAPADQYLGQSGASDKVGKDPKYGDWILQGDDMLGQLLAALDRIGVADNTLVIAASDNGAEHREYAPLRASKRSIYEGGHRVPFVVRWPEHVAPRSRYEHTVCLNDFFATVADILRSSTPANAAEDSVSLLPALLQTQTGPVRTGTIHQSHTGDLALRQANWKLVFHRNGQRELFDIASDLSETQDVSRQHSDVVMALTKQMQSYIDLGRSTPGDPQTNDFQLSLDAVKPRKKGRNR